MLTFFTAVNNDYLNYNAVYLLILIAFTVSKSNEVDLFTITAEKLYENIVNK